MAKKKHKAGKNAVTEKLPLDKKSFDDIWVDIKFRSDADLSWLEGKTVAEIVSLLIDKIKK